MFSYPEDRLAATVEIEGDEKRHPCDWQIDGEAYGLADFRIAAHALLEVGAEVRLTLRCPLGTFTGTAIADHAERDAWGSVRTTYRGNGLLKPAPSEGNHPV